jgi:hypothetical protein
VTVTTVTALHLAWHERAACVGLSSLDMFPQNPGGSGKIRRQYLSRAARACVDCPVMAECLASVTDRARSDRWGVWGGWLWRGITSPPLDILHAAGWTTEPRPVPR